MITPHQALEKYFGYTQFRPLQEEIITSCLAGRDTFVLMPTGGGKSLCYQVPSTLMSGVTIVISPLISLMKDQVDALTQNGIAAAFLNSSQTAAEQQEVLLKLRSGSVKLFYIAPERLVLESFLEILKTLPLNFFVIDEAHCISQWGHDFRPEYRQLLLLKTLFPTTPVMALTATATERVKNDILEQLSLDHPTLYQASFNRPNLTYVVRPKTEGIQLVKQYVRNHGNDSGIIYCLSRKTVERVCDQLQRHGVNALPYHAGLDDSTRRQNQELFIRDDVQVMVATIAFGMGINKPNVRYVIHYDLPKSLEHYYQETGRAGRDGLPSECLFLFSMGDMFMYDRILSEKSESERMLAKQQLQSVIAFAQSSLCRRKQLLNYFNETMDIDTCSACDNCLTPLETFDATIISQKILSCVYRVQGRFGLNHVIDILTGSSTKKIIDRGHHLLSTYNIVTDYTAADLKLFIYELIQQGYLKQSDDRYMLLTLTAKSIPVLKQRERVMLTKREPSVTVSLPHQEADFDSELFDKLRTVRKQLADKHNVPPYMILADKSLKEMASLFPQNETQLLRIHGVGEEKLKRYGQIFLETIQQYRKENNLKPQRDWIHISRK